MPVAGFRSEDPRISMKNKPLLALQTRFDCDLWTATVAQIVEILYGLEI
jgi:hypothetical protein